MLRYLFTVDGDWQGYHAGQPPDPELFAAFVAEEFVFAARQLDGKIVHLIHTSPLARLTMLDPRLVALWRALPAGAALGLHPHEELPDGRHGYGDEKHMAAVLGELVAAARAQGLQLPVFRGGFLAYRDFYTAILEQHGFLADVSGMPGRHRVTSGELISDWRGAPSFAYRLDRAAYRRAGDSGILEIPVGSAGTEESALFLERITPAGLRRLLQYLRDLPHDGPRLVSVITHTYCFPPAAWRPGLDPWESWQPRTALTWKLRQALRVSGLANIAPAALYRRLAGNLRAALEEKLRILKEYGTFVSLPEALALLSPGRAEKENA